MSIRTILSRLSLAMLRPSRKAYWPLPSDLERLHDAAIDYAVEINSSAATNRENSLDHPLSHGALFSLHWRAIVIHRAIRVLCVTGWTPVVPILIRTLLDIAASCYAIVATPENSEFMGFKYTASFLIQALKDGDLPPETLKNDQEQLDKLRDQAKGTDVVRVEQFIKEYKPQRFWYRPEYDGPSAILKTASTDLLYVYKIFSGAVHGGFLGSVVFDDTPDMADINAHDHPRRSRNAIVISSRLLLEISYLRDKFEGTSLENRYKQIMKELYMPQKEKVSTPTEPMTTKVKDDAAHHTAVASTAPTTKKKRWSKWLKFSGAALLLFAFGMQNRQNQQSALLLERTQANELDSRALQKAIGYETLYFSAKATGLDQPAYLAMAAKQYFEGSMAMMATAPGDKEEIARNIRQLHKSAAAVHDLDSLHEFMAADNALYRNDFENEMAGIVEPDAKAKFLGHLYMVLYVIGSVVALAGQALD